MPGKDLALRAEPQSPAALAPPWQDAPAGESLAVRLFRWTRRNGHFTAPAGVLPCMWLAGLLLHQARAGAVTFIGATVAAGCIWFFAPHKWDRRKEQVYARLSAVLGAGWIAVAAWIGPVSGMPVTITLGAALGAGCIAWGIPWWLHKRPRGMRGRERLIAQCNSWWLAYCHHWDLQGSRVIDAKLSGVTLHLRVRGIPGRHTIHTFRAAIPGIESAAEGQSDIGLVRVEPVKGRACEADIYLKKENPLRDAIEYDLAVAPQSVHDLEALGRTETGTWLMVTPRKNRFAIGATRTGKSNDLLVGVANLSGCRDARVVLIDLKGGRSSRPVLKSCAAEYVITDVNEARTYLRMCTAEIAARSVDAYDGNEQLHATEETPAVFTLVDETYGLTATENSAGDVECRRDMSVIASQGSGLEFYLRVYTQNGSLETSVGTEQIRANLTLRVCYRVEEARHGAYVIPEYSRLDASKLEEKGTCYVKDGPAMTPEQVRAPKMEHRLLAQIAAQNASLLGPRPPLRLYCGDQVAFEADDGSVTYQEWWDSRWLRLHPKLRADSPQYQEAASIAGDVRPSQRRTDAEPVPAPVPGRGDAASAAARITADDGLASQLPADFRPDPALVKRLPAAIATEEDRFAEALEAATADSPATPKDLMAASRRGHSWVHDQLTGLLDIGRITQVGRGRYAPAPGSDIREGLREIKARTERISREATGMANAG